MIASSVIANYALILPTVILELMLARYFYHVTHFGNLLSVFVLAILGITSFGALGLVVASVTNTMQETQIINQMLWLMLIFLSGATLPLALLPRAVQRVGLFLPATYLVSGIQRAMVDHAGIFSLGVEIVSLGCWAALAFTISSLLFRWEPEAKLLRNAKLWAVSTILPFILLGIWENHNGKLLATAASMMGDRPTKSGAGGGETSVTATDSRAVRTLTYSCDRREEKAGPSPAQTPFGMTRFFLFCGRMVVVGLGTKRDSSLRGLLLGMTWFRFLERWPI